MFWLFEEFLDYIGIHPHVDLGVKWGELALGFLILAPFIWKTISLFQTMAATTAATREKDAEVARAIERMREKAGDVELETEKEKAGRKLAATKKND
jgi:hypothetical protein